MSARKRIDEVSHVRFNNLTRIAAIFCLLSSIVLTARGQQGVEIKELPASAGGQCPSVEERERVRNEIHQLVNETVYNITASYSHTCNGTPGWKRIAFVNMTDTSYSCPTGLILTSYSKRTCGRSHTTNKGCSSTKFDTGNLQYSQVCGRLRGYQFGSTSAFFPSTNLNENGINKFYVDGVSLTHGGAGSRQHIWTFAAGLAEVTGSFPYEGCPCDTSFYSGVPSFIGNDYFCESGVNSAWSGQYVIYSNDILWDGQNCTDTSACCEFNNPPWFTKNLPTYTTDDIELRLCSSSGPSVEDVPLELIELYIQ